MHKFAEIFAFIFFYFFYSALNKSSLKINYTSSANINSIFLKDEIMQIFFTSGTVGRPKMVPHTHTSYGYCHYITGTDPKTKRDFFRGVPTYFPRKNSRKRSENVVRVAKPIVFLS